MQPPPDPSIFHRYVHDRYAPLKAQSPSLNHRALLLRIADEFWTLDAHSWNAFVLSPSLDPTTTTTPARPADAKGDGDDDDDDDDPPGIVLRTDYSLGSDEAWAAFCGALRDAEREFLADQEASASAPAPDTTSKPDDDGDVEMASASASASAPAPRTPPTRGTEDTGQVGEADADANAEEEGEEGEEPALFHFADSNRYNGISNLRALRLLFDVSVRVAPSSAPSTSTPSSSLLGSTQHQQKQKQKQQKQHQNEHRLTCQRGLQETYETGGRTLWIFDAQSRIDNCARLVSEAGDVATGDSWRARVTHMAELQANLAAHALRIDFGGLDRWDYAERQRNMSEADAGYAAAFSEMK